MNYVKKYYKQMESGKIKVCKETLGIYKQMVEQMAIKKKDFPYYFDEEVGNHAIEFIENYCRHYQGTMAGQLVELELWEKAFVQNLFGWLKKVNDKRRFVEFALEIARKNGKSLLSGCITVYMLVADGEMGAEVYTAATKRDQAKIVYEVANQIIAQSDELSALVKPTTEGLKFKATASTLKSLSKDAKTSDGFNLHYVSYDEIHEVRNRDMYDILKQSMYARIQPLLGCITTSGFFRGGLYDTLHDYWTKVALGIVIDYEIFCVIYKLDSEEEIEDEECWYKSNPGLGTIKDIEKLRRTIKNAKSKPEEWPSVLAKDFNLKQNSVHTWLSYENMVNKTKVDIDYLKNSYCIGGCDLSATTDLTCATLLICKPNDEKIYVLQKYFLPSSRIRELDLKENQEAPYRLWADQGWLEINEGSQVDKSAVTKWFIEMVTKHNIRPLWIGYDRALAGYWVEEMENYGFDLEKVAQGPFTWSQPMKEMGAAFMDKKVIYNNNPMLRWCLSNTGAKALNKDGIETIQPVKIQQHLRIDGVVSLLNAWVVFTKRLEEYKGYIK